MYTAHYIATLILWSTTILASNHSPFNATVFSQDLTQATISFALQARESLFQDSIIISTNSPEIEVKSWTIDQTPTPHFDKQTGNTRAAYTGSGRITVQLIVHTTPRQAASLLIHYATTTYKSPQVYQTTLVEEETAPTAEEAHSNAHEPSPHTSYKHPGSPMTCSTPFSISEIVYNGAHTVIAMIKKQLVTIKNLVTTMLTTSSSTSMQLLLAFILGILMSLTPCIYPMIPITVGLLCASAQKSIVRNFLLAGAYTCGVAVVCALLGLIAVTFGAQCGQLSCNPFVLIGMASMLIYFGGSMLDWYPLYIPRFLQRSSTTGKRGSLLSACLLGMASGTIASPCMSPGLALLLTLVASLNSYLMGFLLLFVFGIGSSMPLLIIGTFSSSMHLLPKAGLWMLEVKKFFGFMLIITGIYYMQFIIGTDGMLLLTALFCLIYSIIYMIACIRSYSTAQRIYTGIIACLLLIPACYVGYIGIFWWRFTTTLQDRPLSDTHVWQTDYSHARAEAIATNRYLLLDFTAEWCSYCMLVDKQILRSAAVETMLKTVVPVKVDGTTDNPSYRTLTQQYKIFGIPSILLIDPVTETVIQSWNSALLEQAPETWVDEIETLRHARPLDTVAQA